MSLEAKSVLPSLKRIDLGRLIIRILS